MINLKLLKNKMIDEATNLLSKYWVEPKHLEYLNAGTTAEAIFLLDKYKEAKIIAGGVDLTRLMRNEIIAPKVLVNIGTIPSLAYISDNTQGLMIGTLSTINDIEKSPIIKDKYTLLAEAAHSVSSPQIRNMATIGGNLCQAVNCWYYKLSPITGKTFSCYRKGGINCYALNGDNRYHAIIGGDKCHAVCQSDMATALLALDAKIKIASPGGERTIPLEAFYTPLGNILKYDELITELQVPALRPDTKQRYLKFRLRNTIDPAISSVTVTITTEERKVSRARIILGGVAPIPHRSIEAEGIVIGKIITEGIAEAAARAAVSKAIPLSMNAYKLSITKALVKRALLSYIAA